MRTQVKIHVNASNNSSLYLHSGSAQLQISNLEKIINAVPTGFNGFRVSDSSMVLSRLDASDSLFPEEGYPGFISQEISDADGVFVNPPYIEIGLSHARSRYIYLAFDNVCREFATVVRVTSLLSTSSQFDVQINAWQNLYMIDLGSLYIPGDVHRMSLRIEFLSWSKAYSNAKVTSVSLNATLIFDGSNIIRYENSMYKMDTQLSITPGINEQFADMELYDRSGLVHQLAQEGLLDKNQSVIISIFDDEGTEIGADEYFTKDWDIQASQSRFNVSCTDNSQSLKNYSSGDWPLAHRTIDSMLHLAFSRANNASWRYNNENTKIMCQRMYDSRSWFNPTDAYTMLQKICTAGMLRIYWYKGIYIVASLLEDCEGLFDD